jgi:hypothetical protein
VPPGVGQRSCCSRIRWPVAEEDFVVVFAMSLMMVVGPGGENGWKKNYKNKSSKFDVPDAASDMQDFSLNILAGSD